MLSSADQKPNILDKIQKRVIEKAEERYLNQTLDKVIDKCFDCVDCFVEGLVLKNESLRLDIQAKKQKLGDIGGVSELPVRKKA